MHVGKPVVLRPFQRNVIKGIYDTPTRRAIFSVGRKNAKTGVAAFLLLLHLVGPEALPNSQIYSTAQAREQAAIVFNYAAKVVRMSPDLQSAVQIRDTAKELLGRGIGTKYRALSAEASTAFGLSPVLVIHDELGQVRGPKSELYEALETSAAAHENPLTIVISTQAPNDADLLSVLIDDALSGADPKVKLFLYTADLDAPLDSEDTWRQANPALGDFQSLDEVRQMAADAIRMPSSESGFRNLVLNQRVEARSPFVSRAVWKANGGESHAPTGVVYGGLDLSAVNDLTAFVCVWEREGRIQCRPFFWTPEVGIQERSRRDHVAYDVWAKQGHLLTTPGATIDYDWVARQVLDLAQEWDFHQIAFDRWRIDTFSAALKRQGADQTFIEKFVPFGQGFKDMAPALDGLESVLLGNRMDHAMHPVLTMCAANAVVLGDPAGNRKLDKAKSTGRIDGMVALAMAVGTSKLAEPRLASFWES